MIVGALDSEKNTAKPIPRARLITRNNEPEIITTGSKKSWWLGDTYVRLLDVSWLNLAMMIAFFYLAANLIFAFAYLEIGNGVANARPGSFGDVFFFSVQTMSTIGYGQMYPTGILANLLVTAEALGGFGFFAVVTGMIFAKFSRPTARVMFSEKAVICHYEGAPHLMVRLANERSNRIVEAKTNMVLLRTVISKEGHKMRRFLDLSTLRGNAPLIRFTWTVMHRIDENSPLFGLSTQDMIDNESEIIVSITGLDETLSQTIHARYSYVAEEIMFDSRFEDVLVRSEDGRIKVNYEHFHTITPFKAVV